MFCKSTVNPLVLLQFRLDIIYGVMPRPKRKEKLLKFKFGREFLLCVEKQEGPHRTQQEHEQ